MKLKQAGRDLILLIHEYTYLRVPLKWLSPADRLPQALRFFTLIGLLQGLALYGAACLLVVMPDSGAALVLVGVDLLIDGVFMLRSLIPEADGMRADYETTTEEACRLQDAPEVERDSRTRGRLFHAGPRGLFWGLFWMVSLYLGFFFIIHAPQVDHGALVVAPVVAHWIYLWLVFGFPAFAPGTLHRGFSRKNFFLASLVALLSLLPFRSPSLYLALLIACLGVYLYAGARRRRVKALDQTCYGAGAAWGQILFMLAWPMLSWLFAYFR